MKKIEFYKNTQKRLIMNMDILFTQNVSNQFLNLHFGVIKPTVQFNLY